MRRNAASASGARPRLVCRITPVALITGVREYSSVLRSSASTADGIRANSDFQASSIQTACRNPRPQPAEHVADRIRRCSRTRTCRDRRQFAASHHFIDRWNLPVQIGLGRGFHRWRLSHCRAGKQNEHNPAQNRRGWPTAASRCPRGMPRNCARMAAEPRSACGQGLGPPRGFGC